MDVKEVTKTARESVAEIFADEQITNLGMEEVVYDEKSEQWRITFGFARPWDRQGDMGVRMGLKAPRAYKVVHIDDSNGNVVALTDQLMSESAACCEHRRYSANVCCVVGSVEENQRDTSTGFGAS